MLESSGLLERTGSVVVIYFFSLWGLLEKQTQGFMYVAYFYYLDLSILKISLNLPG
jgi:hypothetical protein